MRSTKVPETDQAGLPAPVRLRPVALPGEHGGWSLLLEPIALGLLIAPSLTGLFLSLAAVAAFLTRHPLKLAIGDLRRKRNTRRTTLAKRFVLLYSAVAVLSFAFGLVTTHTSFLLPLIVAAPFVIVQFIYDAKGQSRALLPEISGAIGIASIATAISLAGGMSAPVAWALWALLATRAVPTIMYLRVRLQRLRGNAEPSTAPLTTHVMALVIGIVLAAMGLISRLAVGALAVLLVRAVAGLSSKDLTVRAKTLGLRELLFGVVFVLAAAAGFWFHL